MHYELLLSHYSERLFRIKNSILFAVLFFSAYCGFAQPGAALNLDGIDDYVNLPNASGPYDVSSAHVKTFQIWFKNTANQGAHVRIFSTGTANWASGVFFGYAAGSNKMRFELSDGMGVGVAITGASTVRGDNQWHQATGVIDGTIAILYLDGVVDGTVSISGEGAMPSAGAVHVGNSFNNEGSSYFKGDVDELRVWDRVLCGTEILATRNCELNGNESGLVAYYKFNNGNASGNNTGANTLSDYTSGNNAGTLTNMALTGATSNWVSPGGVTTGNICPPFTGVSVAITGINTLCIGNSCVLTANGATSYSWNTGATTPTIIANPTVNTTYSVISTPANCGGNAMFAILVNPVPALTITALQSKICIGNNVILTGNVSGAGAYTYSWTNLGSGASLIAGPTVNTNYTLTATNSQTGCKSTKFFTLAVDKCTGINEEGKYDFDTPVLYPNPNQGVVFGISSEQAVNRVELFDASGRLLFDHNEENIKEIVLAERNQGLYFVKIHTSGKTYMQKLLVE